MSFELVNLLIHHVDTGVSLLFDKLRHLRQASLECIVVFYLLMQFYFGIIELIADHLHLAVHPLDLWLEHRHSTLVLHNLATTDILYLHSTSFQLFILLSENAHSRGDLTLISLRQLLNAHLKTVVLVYQLL
jgi:hypothetical protein